MMKNWKKATVYAPGIAAVFVTVCVAAALLEYEPKRYEAAAQEIVMQETEESTQTDVADTEETGQSEFELEDGIYQGEGNGFAGKIKVSVEVKNQKITDIRILSVEADDDAFFSRAKGVIAEIIEKQSCEVDVVSGATYSSKGIIHAVKNALTGEKDTTVSPNASSEGKGRAAALEEDTEEAEYQDGTYIGTGKGFAGNIKVQVVIQGGQIVSIEIIEHSDGASYIQNASSLIGNIIASQSTNVDTVSGATYSSSGIIKAVRNALRKAETGEEDTEDIPKGKFPYDEGIYSGTAKGYGGNITVAVVIQEKTIKAILVTDAERETEDYLNRDRKSVV